MLVDIDIIMRVFMKKTSYQISKNKGRTTTNKVPMQALWEFSPFFSFSLGEEL